MNRFNPITPRIIPSNKVLCGFTTRTGGVSPPPFDSLNLGGKTSDDRENIRENRSIVYRSVGVDEAHTAFMEQVHGNNITVVTAGGTYSAADGLLTAESGLLLGVLVADCVPLLIYDPVRSRIGVVHCGWRSIIAGIAEQAVCMMADNCKTKPENILAVMGPSAGPCCYETGSETASLFHRSSIIKRGGKVFADLKSELRRRLLATGVKNHNIEIFSDCTICNESLYFSYRRDKKNAGRMMGYIMMRAE